MNDRTRCKFLHISAATGATALKSWGAVEISDLRGLSLVGLWSDWSNLSLVELG